MDARLAMGLGACLSFSELDVNGANSRLPMRSSKLWAEFRKWVQPRFLHLWLLAAAV